MLYKHPGAYYMRKSYYDYTIVDKVGDDYDAALKDGWHTSPEEALKNSTAKKESDLKQDDVLKAQANVIEAKQETEKAIGARIKAEEEIARLKEELEDLKKIPAKKTPSEIMEEAKNRTGGNKK